MSKTKVLHIGQDTGGVKTYVAHILDYADPGAFEFVIMAPANEQFEKYCRERSIPYYPIDLHRGSNPVKNVTGLMKIISVIKKEKPDIIHAHSAKGGFLGRLAAKLTKSKVIYTPHAFSYLSFTGIKRVIFYMLEVAARGWTTSVLAISYSELDRAVHELGFHKNKVKVILNAIPVPLQLPAYKSCSCIKIRMIGRLTYQKNHLLFLEIANVLLKKYPHLQFSILGAGIHDDLSTEIEAYMTEHDLEDKVLIEHWGDAEKSRKFLEETDIYVMTSVFEGLPYSLLEAMSLGIPCVVSAVDGNKDVIRNNENGFACSNLEEFCEKIELLINNQALRKQIGEAGYNYVNKVHNIKSGIKHLEKRYMEVTSL